MAWVFDTPVYVDPREEMTHADGLNVMFFDTHVRFVQEETPLNLGREQAVVWLEQNVDGHY